MTNAELGAHLAAARKIRGLTQRALAEKTGIQRMRIFRIEQGIIEAKVSELVAIFKVLYDQPEPDPTLEILSSAGIKEEEVVALYRKDSAFRAAVNLLFSDMS